MARTSADRVRKSAPWFDRTQLPSRDHKWTHRLSRVCFPYFAAAPVLIQCRFIDDKWVVLFSHPEDYTPVCTTELGAFAKLEPEFTKRGVKLIGLSANTIDSHGGWIKV